MSENHEKVIRWWTELLHECNTDNSPGLVSLLPRYASILSHITERREAIASFIRWLHSETNWLDAPASTKFHLNVTHGLLEHSLNVAETLLKFRTAIAPGIKEESCAIVGLYHDLGKVGLPGRPFYVPNGTGGFSHGRQVAAMAVATRSLYLIGMHVPLTPDESQAIAYHDGMYVPEGKHVQHRETPLLLLVHYADMWSAHVIEENLPDVVDGGLITVSSSRDLDGTRDKDTGG